MAKHCFAAVQMASGPRLAANLEQAARLIGEAARGGAELVVLPEVSHFFHGKLTLLRETVVSYLQTNWGAS